MSDAHEDVYYVRDRRQPFHYTIDNEVYDMKWKKRPGDKRAQKEWKGWKAILAYNALARHASYEGESREQAAVSHKEIAEELDIGITTVKNGLEMLLYNKLLAVEKKPGYPNLYVLLEVAKVERKRKYVRREVEGGRRSAATRPGEPDRRSAANPGRSTAKGRRGASEGGRGASGGGSPKVKRGKGFPVGSARPKSENPERENYGAQGAQFALSEPQSPEETFIGKVLSWHDQCANVTNANYKLMTITCQLRARIKQVGLERAKEIFEHRANGASPNVHAFWQQLNKEGEESKEESRLTSMENSSLRQSIEVKPKEEAAAPA